MACPKTLKRPLNPPQPSLIRAWTTSPRPSPPVCPAREESEPKSPAAGGVTSLRRATLVVAPPPRKGSHTLPGSGPRIVGCKSPIEAALSAFVQAQTDACVPIGQLRSNLGTISLRPPLTYAKIHNTWRLVRRGCDRCRLWRWLGLGEGPLGWDVAWAVPNSPHQTAIQRLFGPLIG